MERLDKKLNRLRKLTALILLLSVLALFLPLNRSGGLVSELASQLANSSSEYKKLKEDLLKVNGAVLLQSSRVDRLEAQLETHQSGSQTTNLTTINNLQNFYSTQLNQNRADTLASLNCTLNQITLFNGSVWACSDQSPGVGLDQQTLSLIANQLSIQNGNSLDLSHYLDNTDVLSDLTCLNGQTAKWNGTDWGCAADNDTDTDEQTLSWNSGARELSLTDGGTVTISDNDTTYSAGTGLSLVGTEFNLNTDDLSAISSVANSDVIIVGTGSGPQKIAYNDLFGSILGALNYRGTWDADANTPDLSTYCDVATKGHYYVVSNPGNTNLGGFTGWQNNDWVICDGTGWQKIESTNQVNSVFGRNGTVTAQNGDYSANQVTFAPNGTLSSTDVQLAIQELRDETLSSNLTDGQIFIGNSSNQATAVNISGDILLTNSGITTITNGSVTSAKIADGSIQTVDMADGSVTTSKVADSSLVFADWASNSCSVDQIPKYNGSVWVCANDTDTNTDEQTLSLIGDQLSISGGNSVNLASYLDNTDTQDLSWDEGSRTLSLTDGGGVVISNTDSLSDLSCSSGQTIKWNSSTWACATDDNTGNTYSAGTGITIDGSSVISSSLGVDIVSGEIVDGTIQTTDVADSAITSGKILDSTIFSADIADGTVTFADLASNGCSSDQVMKYSGTAWVCGDALSYSTWSTRIPIAFGAITTAPTKANTRQNDYIRYRTLDTDEVEIDMLYSATSSTGATAGTGDYLFTLPDGMEFDTTEHPVYTGSINFRTSSSGGPFVLPKTTGFIAYNNVWWGSVYVVPYSSTQFRVVVSVQNSSNGDSSSGWGTIADLTFANFSARINFNFLKQ